MWCANCQSDVAAEVFSDNRRVRCANCNTEIVQENAAANHDLSREAHALLERWSKDSLFDLNQVQRAQVQTSKESIKQSERDDSPVTPQAESTEVSPVGDVKDQVASQQTESSKALPDAPMPEFEFAESSQPSFADLRIDSGAPRSNTPFARSSNWQTLLGQCLAYLGVGGITVGTALVLWGYFGGPEDYAPTGWLITTLGQMLLFLGVVTLVSGGMEQTTKEVTHRIDTLGERLIRIERISRSGSAFSPPHTAERPSTGDDQSIASSSSLTQ